MSNPTCLDLETITPGEWFVSSRWEDKKRGHMLTVSARRDNYSGGVTVATVQGETIFDRESENNASLIAAAPDLLAALHELAEIGEGGVIERRETGKPTWSALKAVATIARAAIAKAETEKQ